MLHKLIIGKVDFDPELGRKQHVRILLDPKNKLPSKNSLTILNQEFGQDLDIGKVFHENSKEKFYFAGVPKELQESLPSKWRFKPFEELTPEKCSDYNIIAKAIEKLGYKLK